MVHFIQTQSGVAFNLANPSPDMVDLDDIATALSYTVRFNGHTGTSYSVAEHSVWVSRMCPPEARMHGLMHDAHEAYTGDIVSPLKKLLPGIGAIEARIQKAIHTRLWITGDYPEVVKEADVRMLATERLHFFGAASPDWGLTAEPYYNGVDIKAMSPEVARLFFLEEFDKVKWGL